LTRKTLPFPRSPTPTHRFNHSRFMDVARSGFASVRYLQAGRSGLACVCRTACRATTRPRKKKVANTSAGPPFLSSNRTSTSKLGSKKGMHPSLDRASPPRSNLPPTQGGSCGLAASGGAGTRRDDMCRYRRGDGGGGGGGGNLPDIRNVYFGKD
jgi:hypothetical protein